MENDQDSYRLLCGSHRIEQPRATTSKCGSAEGSFGWTAARMSG
jgi:hypothetical protein